MDTPDLYELRQGFNRQRILLCFNGPISRSLIEEIGTALRHHLESAKATPGKAMDVFSVYIEMSQNIRHYARQRNYDEAQSSATVIIGRDDEGRYVISAGNLVERSDGQVLLEYIQGLAGLDKPALKARYKEQLRQPRDPEATSGAGLGLIDIARKACEPLNARLSPLEGDKAFFSLSATL